MYSLIKVDANLTLRDKKNIENAIIREIVEVDHRGPYNKGEEWIKNEMNDILKSALIPLPSGWLTYSIEIDLRRYWSSF